MAKQKIVITQSTRTKKRKDDIPVKGIKKKKKTSPKK